MIKYSSLVPDTPTPTKYLLKDGCNELSDLGWRTKLVTLLPDKKI